MFAFLRTIAVAVWRLTLLSGWIAFGLLALLFGAEASGLLTSIAQTEVSRSVGKLPVRIEHAGVRLFPARIVISGLQLGEQTQLITIDRLEIDWTLDFESGFSIRSLHGLGGTAQLGSELPDFSSEPAASGGSSEGKAPMELDLRIENLGLSLRSDRWGTLPLGRLDVEGRLDSKGVWSWIGRLRPRFSPDGTRPSEIVVRGSHDARNRRTEVEWHGAAVALSLSYLPEGRLLRELRPWQPKGTLDIEGQLIVDSRAKGRIRARVKDADAVLAGGTQRLQPFDADLDLSLDAAGWSEALTLDAWSGRAQIKGDWEGARLLALAELQAGVLRGHASVRDLALDERLVDLAGGDEHLREIWRGFAPRGRASLYAGWEWKLAWEARSALRMAVELDPQGELGITYLGWPDADRRSEGFPLPADEVRGAVVFAREPGSLRPLRTGLIDLVTRTPAGVVRCDGLIHSHAIDAPPFLPGYGASELDLSIQSSALALGEPIYAALRGLEPSVEAASTWQPFDPREGELEARFRLTRTVDMPYAAVDLDAGLRKLKARWEDLPLPVSGLDGRLRVRSDGKGAVATAFEGEGLLESARSLRVQARLRTDPRSKQGSGDECVWIRVDVGSLALNGPDVLAIAARLPEVETALAETGAQGTLDLAYERTRAGKPAQPAATLAVRPREVWVRPRELPLQFEWQAGRVLLDLSAAGTPRIRAAPLIASWNRDTPLALWGEWSGVLQLVAAGIDPSAPELRSELRRRLGATDLAGVELTGRLDLDAEFSPSAANSLRARVQLCGNSLEVTDKLSLDGLRGRIEYDSERLSGSNLEASLAGSRLDLTGLDLFRDPEGWELNLRLRAEELPLDAPHLAGLVGASTLDALFGELALNGRVQIDDARLSIRGSQGRAPRVEFSGDVSPSETTMVLGLPLRIGSARARIEQMVLEDERLRVSARVEDLYGDIAGRVLGPASFRLSYIEPLLSIDDLDASLEGGRLLPIGGAQHVSGSSFAITLAPPYDFQLGISLLDVDVGGLLRGLFDSEFATKGRVNAELRLEGNTEQLLGLEGSGSLRVRDSKLWSIPVFRALFSQLGLDSTVVFENMRARLRIADGRIVLTQMAVESPILQLVGSRGSLDFDGALKFDLELRYALIDRLGPFTRLFYSIQNQLMSVEIRGDMARPFVKLKNPVTSLFGGGQRARALPLPGLSPLPPRF